MLNAGYDCLFLERVIFEPFCIRSITVFTSPTSNAHLPPQNACAHTCSCIAARLMPVCGSMCVLLVDAGVAVLERSPAALDPLVTPLLAGTADCNGGSGITLGVG